MKIKESDYLNILLRLYFLDKPLIKKEIQEFLGYRSQFNYASQIIKDLIDEGYLEKVDEIVDKKGLFRNTYKVNKDKLLGLLSSTKTFKYVSLIYDDVVEDVIVSTPFDLKDFKNSLNLNSY